MLTNRCDFLSAAPALAVLPFASRPEPAPPPSALLAVNGIGYRLVYHPAPPSAFPAGSIVCRCEDGVGVMAFEPDPAPEGRADR